MKPPEQERPAPLRKATRRLKIARSGDPEGLPVFNLAYMVWCSQFKNPDLSRGEIKKWESSYSDWKRRLADYVIAAVIEGNSGEIESLGRAVVQIQARKIPGTSQLRPLNEKQAVILAKCAKSKAGTVTMQDLLALLEEKDFSDDDKEHRTNKKFIERVVKSSGLRLKPGIPGRPKKQNRDK